MKQEFFYPKKESVDNNNQEHYWILRQLKRNSAIGANLPTDETRSDVFSQAWSCFIDEAVES